MSRNTYIKSPLNYTGGKHKLLPQIMPLFPEKINAFVDLFCGGCNVAANIDAERIIANNSNIRVIEIYREFQNHSLDYILNHIEGVINEFGLNMQDAEPYNKFRQYYNLLNISRLSGVENAERKYNVPILLFILVCYSFNHQIRFNSKGEFNMPFGKDRSQWNEDIKKNLINFHNALTTKPITFFDNDFRQLECLDKLGKDDFVYCDPPYLITCATYNERLAWDEEDERELLGLLDKLDSRNVKFALSNVLFNKGKTNDILLEWSEKYNVHHLDNSYSNCSYHTKDRTSKPDEVLITNY